MIVAPAGSNHSTRATHIKTMRAVRVALQESHANSRIASSQIRHDMSEAELRRSSAEEEEQGLVRPSSTPSSSSARELGDRNETREHSLPRGRGGRKQGANGGSRPRGSRPGSRGRCVRYHKKKQQKSAGHFIYQDHSESQPQVSADAMLDFACQPTKPTEPVSACYPPPTVPKLQRLNLLSESAVGNIAAVADGAPTSSVPLSNKTALLRGWTTTDEQDAFALDAATVSDVEANEKNGSYYGESPDDEEDRDYPDYQEGLDHDDWGTKFKPRRVRKEILKIKPKMINFTQSSIRNRFHDGRSIYTTLNQLDKGEITVDDIPKVWVVRNPKDDSLWSLNNRRLYTFKMFCPEEEIEVYLLNDPAYCMGFGDPACGKDHPEIAAKYKKRSMSCPRIREVAEKKASEFREKLEAKHNKERSTVPLAQLAALAKKFQQAIKPKDRKRKKLLNRTSSYFDALVAKRKLKKEQGSGPSEEQDEEDASSGQDDGGSGAEQTGGLDENGSEEEHDDGVEEQHSISIQDMPAGMGSMFDAMPDWLRKKKAADERRPPTLEEVRAGLRLLIGKYDKTVIEAQVKDLGLKMITEAWLDETGGPDERDVASSPIGAGDEASTAASSTPLPDRTNKGNREDGESQTGGEVEVDHTNKPSSPSSGGTAMTIGVKSLTPSISSASLLRAGAARWRAVGQSVGGLRRMLNAIERYGIKGVPDDLL